MKRVYVGMGTDIIHHGHINIIEVARELGEVTIGLLSDSAVTKFARIPLLSFDERKKILLNIKGVAHVIEQNELDYTINLKELKPDFVVHGDDWQQGPQRKIREKVIQLLKEWGGKLIEPEYTVGISSSKIREELLELGTTPHIRRKLLRKLMAAKDVVRIMEVHNGLSAILVENTKLETDDFFREFDAMWLSSLTGSTAKGKPDTEYVDQTSRMQTLSNIMDVSTKPVIVDGDTGGKIAHFPMLVKALEKKGVSAVVIEDKTGLKRNSLFGTEVFQQLDSIEKFSEKITIGKKAQLTKEFMIFARIESLIAGLGLEDAIRRAKAYIQAGADGIMIHSRKKDGQEIVSFMKAYNQLESKVPVISVPSSYNQFSEDELHDIGFSIVIYANHLLRSAYPAMQKTALSILQNRRSLEADKDCMSIKEILNVIPN